MVGIFTPLPLYKRSHSATSASLDKKERQFLLIDETLDTPDRDGMDERSHGVEGEVEFWPIEHPMEPSDEDRPVKCPMPDSSVINKDGGMHEDRYSESLRKRVEVAAMVNKEGKVEEAAEEPPIRAVRKRHHTLTQGDHTITPLLRMPPLPRFPTQNVSMFQMLRQFDKFES